MSVQAQSGPIVVFGRNPSNTNYTSDPNGDRGPSMFDGGLGVIDPRVGYRGSNQSGRLATQGWMTTSSVLAMDFVPATAAVAAIAAAQNVTSGTPMTLVASSGAGVVVTTTAATMIQSGTVVPAGTRSIGGMPSVIAFGGNGAIAAYDPRSMTARAVSITGATSATGGAFTVRGWDLDGFPMTETITAGAGAVTTNGKKAFSAIASVTPGFSNAINYSVGTTDIFGFPIAVYYFGNVTIVWNNAAVTANTGFTAADATNPATATTGDTRGTYAVQSASDGTKRLQVIIDISPYQAAAANGTTSLYGISQYGL